MKIVFILLFIISIQKSIFCQEDRKVSESEDQAEQEHLEEFMDKHEQFIHDNPENEDYFDQKIKNIIEKEKQIREEYEILEDAARESDREEGLQEILPEIQIQVVEKNMVQEHQDLKQQGIQKDIFRDESERNQQVDIKRNIEKRIRDDIESKTEIEDDQERDNNNFGRKRLVKGPTQYDSRVEIRFFNPEIPWHSKIIANSLSVGVIIEKSRLHLITDSIYQLELGVTLGVKYNLCISEAFESQPCVGIGTAFVINDQEMLTAGHVFTGNINEYAIIFGYEKIFLSSGYGSLIPIKNVYFPTEITRHNYTLDIIQFKTDRKINRRALKYSSDKLIDNSIVYMIGFPMGLPQKVAMNARVIENTHPQYFYTSLDAFQGNSGSPVFNLLTNEVIGILVSGEVDYSWTGTCNKSTDCSFPYCKGEKIIRIEQFMLQ